MRHSLFSDMRGDSLLGKDLFAVSGVRDLDFVLVSC